MEGVCSVSRCPIDNSTGPEKKQAWAATVTRQATQVNLSQARTADITIVTAEGDKVTLSSGSTVEASFATYNAQGTVGGKSASVSAVATEFQRSSDFSLTVDGDLNREEMREIRKAIRIIQRSARDVFTGHADKAAARTDKLADLDQLASIDADVEFKREISITQVTAQSSVPPAQDSADLPATQPEATPATPPQVDFRSQFAIPQP